ncbi:MAG: amidohydrolase family protein [Pirellulales bacterium]|nr:amidohydrolase family protein [Pirellulales bacterium]
MNSEFSLRARWVLPMEGPPLDGGVVTVADGRVTRLGMPTGATGPLRDLGDVVLLPGLINAHTHLEFSSLQQPLGDPGMPLAEWIRLVIAHRKRSDQDTGVAIAQGLQECLQQGVTTVGEMATASAAVYSEQRAGQSIPQLALFHEVIGFSAARIESVLADVEHRLVDRAATTSGGISPHAPYTVHPELFARLVDLAKRNNIPVAVHLAESREELRLLDQGDGPLRDLLEERSMWDPQTLCPGSRPIDFLKILARAPRALVVHGNYLSADEIEFIAEYRQRMGIVYCPRTHAYFAHAPYPLPAMLNAGVPVVVGTDSRASSPDLSLLEELRFVFRQYPELGPEQILAMGTTVSAATLGLSKLAGSITPGKPANLCAVPTDVAARHPADAVLGGNALPCGTWLRGQEV